MSREFCNLWQFRRGFSIDEIICRLFKGRGLVFWLNTSYLYRNLWPLSLGISHRSLSARILIEFVLLVLEHLQFRSLEFFVAWYILEPLIAAKPNWINLSCPKIVSRNTWIQNSISTWHGIATAPSDLSLFGYSRLLEFSKKKNVCEFLYKYL